MNRRIVLAPNSLSFAITMITQCAKDDGKWQVEIAPVKHDKTHQQRKWFHAMCSEIGEPLGYTTGQIKEMIKADYFGVDTVRIGERTYQFLKSSEELDRMDYGKLCEFAMQWGAERGVVLSDPSGV